MTVAIIGSMGFKMTRTSMRRLVKVITNLVVKNGARKFLFAIDGAFDFACWAIVFKLKIRYPDIRRICVRTNSVEGEALEEIMQVYEEIFVPDQICDAGMLAECVRNEVMVERCDVLVTYFQTKNLRMPRIKGYEEMAAEHSQKLGKRVINLFR